jgi:uncharacterized protein (TIGR00369 family)
MTDPLSPVQLGELMARSTPQTAAMGLRVVSAGKGFGSMAVPYRADLVGDAKTGVLAGGVITTLLDHVCGMAASSALLGSEGGWGVATLDLRIDYMRAAEPGLDVHARAHCYRITRSVAFVRATAYDRDPDDPVATAQAAFMINTAGLPPPVDPVVDEARP